MSKLRLSSFVLIFLLTLVSSPVFSGEYSYDFQRIVEVNEPVSLDLRLLKGKVTITGSENNRVIIDAVKSVRASNSDEAEEIADHIEIKVRSDNNKIKIETNYLKIVNRSQSFWNKLLGTGSSESYGQVDYHISVPTRTSVVINGSEAMVDLSSLEGDVDITCAAGETRGEYIFGDVTVAQPVGNVELNWIEGDIRIKSNSAMLSVKQLRGAIDISTYSGKVNIETELDSPRDYYIETTSGEITFLMPQTAMGQLQVQTETGRISTEIPIAVKSVSRNKLVGNFGDGGPSINIVSTTGDVNIKQF